MGIDGIGKSGAPPPLDGPAANKTSSDRTSAGTEFRIEQPQATPPSDLERLDSGQLSREEYLQARVEQATKHLEGRLPVERLEEVKQQLRAQLEVDPVLGRLLQRVTGSAGSEGAGTGAEES
jgi:hypothetical protein